MMMMIIMIMCYVSPVWSPCTDFNSSQGPPEYRRSCDYSEQVTIIAYDSK